MAVLTDDEKRMTDTDETFRLPALDPAALPVHPGDGDDGTAAIEVVPPPPDVSASWLADPGSVTDESGRARFQSLELLRLLLLIPVSVKVFGLGGGLVSTVVELLCGFASASFFLISGFLVLYADGDTEGRILRCIRRTAVSFLAMLVISLAANWIFYAVGGMDIFAMTPFRSKRFWFSFLVLNVWPYPIGAIIWYVQALLYGYIIIYFLYRLGLMRFDWVFFILLFAFSVVSGELSYYLKFFPLGYGYLPPCFLTQALPYLLLGGILRRILPSLAETSPWLFVLGFVGGLLLSVLELVLLDVSGNLLYVGHFAPMAVSAFCLCALCALCVFFDGDWLFYLAAHARLYLGFTYLFIHPVGVVAALVLARLRVFDALIPWMWAVGFLLCLLVAGVIGVIRDNVAVKRVPPGEHQI